MNKINILLTAIGGDIGYSIYKILKEQDFIDNIICTDISEDNAGAKLCKNFAKISKASDKNYISDLENLAEKHKIDLVIPTSEPELRFFHANKTDNILSAKIIKASYDAMEIGFNKYKTYEFLKSNNLPYPWTEKCQPLNLPCIYKDSEGCGSKGICLIENEEDLKYYSKKYPDYIFQEYIEGDEYTCGLYGSESDIRTIIFKRELKGGLTGHGILVEDSKIENLLIKIAQNIKLKGSINVQLRKTKTDAFVFEINPRFSSTVLFRDKLGFHDLIWSLKEACNLPIEEYKPMNKNIEFYKMYDEIVSIKEKNE